MDEWVAVFEKNKTKEFIEPNKDLKCSYWICKKDTGKRNTTTNNQYIIYEYLIFDNDINEKEIVQNHWKLRRIEDYKYKNAYDHAIRVTISDPKGEIRTELFYTNYQAVFDGLEYLEKASFFANWQTFDLKEEIDNLKIENEQLKKRLDAIEKVVENESDKMDN